MGWHGRRRLDLEGRWVGGWVGQRRRVVVEVVLGRGNRLDGGQGGGKRSHRRGWRRKCAVSASFGSRGTLARASAGRGGV